MNMLVISYFSDNDGLPCSHHVDDRIDALAESGVKPVVLSSLCAGRSSEYKKYRLPSLAASGLRFELRYITKRRFKNNLILKIIQIPFLLVLLPFYLIESIVLNFGSSWSWFILAGLCSAFISKKHKCEVVYSTGGAISAHIAGYICTKMTGLKWVAELQDPIVGSWEKHNKLERKFNQYVAKIIANKASSVVFMTQGSLGFFETMHKLSGRGHVIFPGAKSDIFDSFCNKSLNLKDSEGISKKEKLVLGHFGSLGRARNTKCLMQAIEEICELDSSVKDIMSFIIVGNYDNNQKQLFNRLQSFVKLDIRGKQTHKEALEAMCECDVLLLIQHASIISSYTIPSKIYEYLHSGIPVFALTYKNKELEEMVRSLGHYCADQADINEVNQELLKIINNWKSGILKKNIKPSPYTTKQAAEQFLDIA